MDTAPCDGESIIPEGRRLRRGSKMMVVIQLPPVPPQQVLRCLADLQKIELGEGVELPPAVRFNLTQERLAQNARLN